MAEFSPVRIGGAPHSRQLHEGLSKTPIRRGRLYLEAGADCIFPIGVGDEAALPALVDGIPSPINVIAGFSPRAGSGAAARVGRAPDQLRRPFASRHAGRS